MSGDKAPEEHPALHPRRDTAPPVRTMHDDVDPCSDDICCCEPEPRWMRLSGDESIAARLADAEGEDAVSPTASPAESE